MNRFLAYVLLAALSSGCATVFTGTRDDITVTSEPAGATVYIDDLDYGKTPVTFPLKREALRNQSGTRVTLKKEGYEDKSFNVQKEFNAVSVCNLGNVLFWGVDFITGAVLLYDPTSYKVNLQPAATAPAPASPQPVAPVPPTSTPAPQQGYTPKKGDPIDFVRLYWGEPTQTSVIDGVTKLLYERPDAAYLISLTADRKIGDVQTIAR